MVCMCMHVCVYMFTVCVVDVFMPWCMYELQKTTLAVFSYLLPSSVYFPISTSPFPTGTLGLQTCDNISGFM